MTSATPVRAVPSDIEIAQAATLKPVLQLAQERLGIPAEALEPYGHYKAKIDLTWLNKQTGPNGKLILGLLLRHAAR